MSMNWYKKAQIQMIDDPDSEYSETGHGYFFGMNEDTTHEEYPNYMWLFTDGKLSVQEETEEIYSHGRVPGWWAAYKPVWSRIYKGRYDSYNNIITLVRPADGVGAFREIPSTLLSALQKKFPDAEQIFNYSSNQLTNQYKQASQNFYILGKRDSDFINGPFNDSFAAMRLKNGEIIYGEANAGWHMNHWELYLIAAKYIGPTKNLESLGYLSSDGVYTVKISDINNLNDYMFGDG